MTSSSQVRRSRRESLDSQRIEKAKKERRNKILFAIAGVIIVGAVIGTAIWGIVSTQNKSGTELPPNNAHGHGIWLAPPVDGLPTLEIYSDYNCGVCASAHRTLNAVLNEAIEQKKVNVMVISMSFVAETSRQASIASACADFQGAFPKFHDQLFLHASGGLDYEDIDTIVPEAAGLTGDALTNFSTCLNNQDTGSFVDAEAAYGAKNKVNATPAFRLDGVDVREQLFNTNTQTFDPDLMRKLLEMN
ncbi:MAG: DsbA family protein [Propionibacteriaceae bacterium]|jgi:protein-disulfide isomerase|nr:DsbA family protein [Propionibacteriaceae bacterium]